MRANGASNHTAHGSEHTTTKLVADKRASSTSHQHRTEATFALGATGSSRSTGLAILLLVRWVSITVLLYLLMTLVIAMLGRRAVTLVLGRIWRLAAVMVVALIVLAWRRRSIALLWCWRVSV